VAGGGSPEVPSEGEHEAPQAAVDVQADPVAQRQLAQLLNGVDHAVRKPRAEPTICGGQESSEGRQAT